MRSASCVSNICKTLLLRLPVTSGGVRQAKGNKSSQSPTNLCFSALRLYSAMRVRLFVSTVLPLRRYHNENLFLFLLRINLSLGISFLATRMGGVVPLSVKNVYLLDDSITLPRASSMI